MVEEDRRTDDKEKKKEETLFIEPTGEERREGNLVFLAWQLLTRSVEPLFHPNLRSTFYRNSLFDMDETGSLETNFSPIWRK